MDASDKIVDSISYYMYFLLLKTLVGHGVSCHFQQYFSYIVAFSFINKLSPVKKFKAKIY